MNIASTSTGKELKKHEGSNIEKLIRRNRSFEVHNIEKSFLKVNYLGLNYSEPFTTIQNHSESNALYHPQA